MQEAERAGWACMRTEVKAIGPWFWVIHTPQAHTAVEAADVQMLTGSECVDARCRTTTDKPRHPSTIQVPVVATLVPMSLGSIHTCGG
jgi:hypothetical protein